jgi:SAM-dependent methyltransferase
MISHVRQLTGLLPQPVRFALRRALYAGDAARCPICGYGVRKWNDHGGGAAVLERRRVVGGARRIADSCPICHGKDRSRLIQLFLQREAGVGARELRILDFAPDYGLHRWIVAQPKVDYVAADIDAARYRHIRNFVETDIAAMSFPDDSFDIVICSHVLEHVPDDAAAMRELRRVLRPGGAALLLVPEATDGGPTDEDPEVVDPAARNERFGQWDHVRLYARGDFPARLAAQGFAVEAWNPGSTDPALAAERRLNPEEFLRVARK